MKATHHKKIVFQIVLLSGFILLSITTPHIYGQSNKTGGGKKITIMGVAQNSKTVAVVISEDKTPYFLSGVNPWDKDKHNKTVKVTGKLYTVEQNGSDLVDSRGNRIMGLAGNTLFLKNPKVKIIVLK